MDMQVDQAGYYFSAASIQRLCTGKAKIQLSRRCNRFNPVAGDQNIRQSEMFGGI